MNLSPLNTGPQSRRPCSPETKVRAKSKKILEGLDYGRDVERNKNAQITKQKINNADEKTRTFLLAEYSEINKRVKRYARRDKRAWTDKPAHKVQLAAEINNSRELHQITKRLAERPLTCNQVGIKVATGRLLATPQNQLIRWQEHFKNNLAVLPQQVCTITTQTTPDTTKIPSGATTGNEIKIAIKHLKSNKASGLDNFFKSLGTLQFVRRHSATVFDSHKRWHVGDISSDISPI